SLGPCFTWAVLYLGSNPVFTKESGATEMKKP
ncbi:MAG: hypothetical protein ACI9VR_005159, partial [Cognaticolwellia sp.]